MLHFFCLPNDCQIRILSKNLVYDDHQPSELLKIQLKFKIRIKTSFFLFLRIYVLISNKNEKSVIET